jgi:hypothetical protein
MGKICCQIAVKARNVTNINRLKTLVEVLEQSGGSRKIFGTAEGGTRHELFAGVRPCPSRA